MIFIYNILEKLGLKESKSYRCCWCLVPIVKKNRPMPFDNYACSAECEMMVGVFLDGCNGEEMNNYIEIINNQTDKEFKKHCKEAMIKYSKRTKKLKLFELYNAQ